MQKAPPDAVRDKKCPGEAMSRIESFIFGGVEFSEDEAFLRFRFRLLYGLLMMGIVFCGLFIAANALRMNNLPAEHVFNIKLMFFASIVLTIALYGHKERYMVIASLYVAASMLVYFSAMMLVPDDSMRATWYFASLPAVYILLGSAAGIVVSLISLASIYAADAYLGGPLSANALTTVTLTMVFSGIFLFFYTRRFYSFYLRMVKANRQLRELAATDPLTGLTNARAYYALCNQMILSALRLGTPFAVLFIDIDHFKRINDTHGHEAGDEVLREVAKCIRRTIRQSDVPGRIGGEEFSVFLPDADEAGAIRLAEKLRVQIEEMKPVVADVEKVHVTASIGLASSRDHHLAIEHIQREADLAMYQAKQQGRNRVKVFEQAA